MLFRYWHVGLVRLIWAYGFCVSCLNVFSACMFPSVVDIYVKLCVFVVLLLISCLVVLFFLYASSFLYVVFMCLVFRFRSHFLCVVLSFCFMSPCWFSGFVGVCLSYPRFHFSAYPPHCYRAFLARCRLVLCYFQVLAFLLFPIFSYRCCSASGFPVVRLYRILC